MRTHQRVEVTRQGRRAAVILSADDYDSIMETLDILGDAAAMAVVREAALADNPFRVGKALRSDLVGRYSARRPSSVTSMASDVMIRPSRGAEEFPALVAIWRSAVVATHDFLAHKHRADIEARLASTYLPNVRLVVAERDGRAVGFAGTDSGKLEMLFVDAESRGSGIGIALLEHVIAAHGVNSVDVNEQNDQAVGFYEHAGFVVAGRSPVDGDGLPYPLWHMTLASPASQS